MFELCLIEGLLSFFFRLFISCHYNAIKCTCFDITKIDEENFEGSSNDFFDIIFMKVMTNVLFDAMMISTGH